jgi:hypothetical protein
MFPFLVDHSSLDAGNRSRLGGTTISRQVHAMNGRRTEKKALDWSKPKVRFLLSDAELASVHLNAPCGTAA